MSDNFFKINRGINLNPQSGTPSNASNGDIYYDTSLNKFRKYENGAWGDIGSGSGSSGSGINYISGNSNAEVDVAGWVAYADAAAATPVDGTGGSPTVTITRSTSSPLRGTGSFLITKDAANRQGQGVSYDFTIDSTDKGKTLALSFDFDAVTSVTGAASDVRIYVYDVTNSSLLSPSTTYIPYASGNFSTLFTASSTSTSYRLIFHVATTNASAWTFKYDNVSVGPQAVINGLAGTDWSDITITPSASFGTTSAGVYKYRRMGDMIQVWGKFIAGTTTSSAAYIDVPATYPIDYTKRTTTTNTVQVGTLRRGVSAGPSDNKTNFGATGDPLFMDGSLTTRVFFAVQSQSSAYVKNNADAIYGSGDLVGFYFEYPVVGWNAQVTLSNGSTFRISNVLTNGTRVTTTPAVLGEYRSRSKTTATSNTFADAAPTTAINATDGIRIHGADYTSAQTSGLISLYDIFIGKQKNFRAEVYSSAAMTGTVFTDYNIQSTTVSNGVKFGYDPSTGVLTVESGLNELTTNTTRNIGVNTSASGVTNGYFDIIVSENALALGVDVPRTEIWLYDTTPGHGSTNTRIPRFATSVVVGTDATYTDSATLGTTITINKAGIYTISYVFRYGAAEIAGISKNSSDLSNDINAITASTRMIASITSGSGDTAVGCISTILNAGDIIRPHDRGAAFTGTTEQFFRITKISN